VFAQVYGLPFGMTRRAGRWLRPLRARAGQACGSLLHACARKRAGPPAAV